MYKRIALLLFLMTPAIQAIDFWNTIVAKEYTKKMLLLLQSDQGSDLLALPDDVRKCIGNFMLLSIKEKERWDDKWTKTIILSALKALK